VENNTAGKTGRTRLARSLHRLCVEHHAMRSLLQTDGGTWKSEIRKVTKSEVPVHEGDIAFRALYESLQSSEGTFVEKMIETVERYIVLTDLPK
jgi:hypothetical protein